MRNKIHYPRCRKSPCKHHVKTHRRKNCAVHDYDRGKGKGAKKSRHLALSKGPHAKKKSSSGYSVAISYGDGSSESVHVPARSFVNAVNPALLRRMQTKEPLVLTLRKV